MTKLSQSSLNFYYSLSSRIEGKMISPGIASIFKSIRRVSGQYLLFLAGLVYGGAIILALELYCR
ncbi:MAG: hypothetical protein O3C20_06460 [Verrucomicrobia bacterium]|nr:hypothetical protein [Verrucomicrobiota bacterium]